MTIEELAKSEGIWNLDERKNSDLVLKSSVCFSRNITGYPFAHKLNRNERASVGKLLLDTVKTLPHCSNCDTYNVRDIDGIDRKIFSERNIIDDEYDTDSILVLAEDQNLYFIINHFDHLQLITSWPGYQFDSIYILGKKIVTRFESDLGFSFSPRFGYLVADPERAGTGMVLSIIIHLAGFVNTNSINELMVDIDGKGLSLRGSWIDGYYELFNSKSTDGTEKQLYSNTLHSLDAVIKKERSLREDNYESNTCLIEDKVWRSYGILLSCRMISLYEALDLLSNLRLGISLGIINYVSIRDINLLLLYIQDYHLRKRYNINDDAANLEEMRALFIRDYLKEVI